MLLYSTHRLQPLDVGLFSPLSTAYTKQLNKVMFEGYGLVSITKRLFYPLFQEAYHESFTQKNIENAFAKVGIWLLNPDKILSKLKKPAVKPPVSETNELPKTLQTSKTCYSIRCIQKAYKLERRESLLNLIFHANVQLSAQVDIKDHVISGLYNAIKIEHKKRKRGKRLNLLRENDVGAQFFSPLYIQAAQLFQAQKEADEQAEKQRIADKKAKATANKAQKEALKAERAVQAELHQQHVQEEKAQKEAAKKAKSEARKAELEAKKAAKHASKSTSKPKTAAKPRKERVVVNISGSRKSINGGRNVAFAQTTRTRTVMLLSRFHQTL
jgi:hypothetical protein